VRRARGESGGRRDDFNAEIAKLAEAFLEDPPRARRAPRLNVLCVLGHLCVRRPEMRVTPELTSSRGF